MSTETRYTLTTPQGGIPLEEISAKLAEIVDETPLGHPEHKTNASMWEEILDGIEPMNWHSIEKDMAQLSQQWPGVLFTIDCKGQTPEDLWRVYAKDGMYQVATAHVTYAEPDPNEMKYPS